MSQSFEVGIERVPRFGAVKLSELLLSLSGWLVLGLLVAGGVVWQAPMRAVRYTLIVASTEHEFSSGCCRVFDPDLSDAEKPRSAAAAVSGRFLLPVTDDPLRAEYVGVRSGSAGENRGLRNTQRDRILATPQYKRNQFVERRCWKKCRRFCCCRRTQIARRGQEKKVDFRSVVWYCWRLPPKPWRNEKGN